MSMFGWFSQLWNKLFKHGKRWKEYRYSSSPDNHGKVVMSHGSTNRKWTRRQWAKIKRKRQISARSRMVNYQRGKAS